MFHPKFALEERFCRKKIKSTRENYEKGEKGEKMGGGGERNVKRYLRATVCINFLGIKIERVFLKNVK